MSTAPPSSPCVATGCPDPLARAPRLPEERPAADRLLLPPPALQGAVVAVIRRDLRGRVLSAAQRLSHFPASPVMTLSWFQGLEGGAVEHEPGQPPCWRPFGSTLVIAGSQSRPSVSWTPSTGRAGMVCFTADVAQALFGIEPAAVHDRFVAASEVMDASWSGLLEALAAATDDDATLEALRIHVGPRWQALQGRAPRSTPTLSQFGRHWVDRLAWQAHEWRRTHSPRQVERRVKAYSGRSLREWQALVRTEGLFHTARARQEAGLSIDWAELALDENFADQSHLVRSTRRITGFAPGEFAERYAQDESFWVYRLWV